MLLLTVLFLLQDPAAADLAAGKALFQGQCAVCHGIDGHGSTGPTLVRPRLPRAATEAALIKVIAEGIPNTGMPAAWQMTPREVKLTALYVKSIGTVAQETKLPGDPAKGKEVYRKTGCANCHIIDGQGNGYGPELTGVGLRRNAQHLRDSILKPAADVAGESLTVRVVTQQGNTQTVGVRLNEDSFTIQLRDMSGRIHSFQKANLKTLEKQKDVSLMPAFDKLAPEELDDLVNYLANLRGVQ
jgi:cytochrome c oxidase cbb3-type subunit 3